MAKLSEDIQRKLAHFCELGDECADYERYRDALVQYNAALALLPEPKKQWEATLWIYGAIGDAHYLSKDYSAALETFQQAIKLPQGEGNPFLHLRLGQSYYELGNLSAAAKELERAYEAGGDEMFEEDDPKYWELLKSTIESKRKPS